MAVQEAVREGQDPTRIGEEIQAVLYYDRRQLDEEEDPLPVWSKALELAGVEAPLRVLGWVPVYQCSSQSPKDAARAKEANMLVAELASIMGTNSRREEQYWINVDNVWKRICAHKKAKRKKFLFF